MSEGKEVLLLEDITEEVQLLALLHIQQEQVGKMVIIMVLLVWEEVEVLLTLDFLTVLYIQG